jgi:hypothetical protein
MVVAAWHAVASWYTGAEFVGDGPREALIAIASVAAVAWTGGFIIRGFPGTKTTLALMEAMDYLQTAFFGPIIVLLASPAALRTAAIAFVALYAAAPLALARRQRRERISALPGISDTYLKLVIESGYTAWLRRYIALYLAPLALIFLVPDRGLAAWIAAALLFIGYQALLSHLYRDAQ